MIEIGHPVLRMEPSEETYGLIQMAENIADLLEVIKRTQSCKKDILPSPEEYNNSNTLLDSTGLCQK